MSLWLITLISHGKKKKKITFLPRVTVIATTRNCYEQNLKHVPTYILPKKAGELFTAYYITVNTG